MDLDETQMDGRCAASHAIDAAAECEAWLREAGMHVAAVQAHDATATLRLARRTCLERRRRDGDPSLDGSRWEALVTEAGHDTGVALMPLEMGVACRGRVTPDGRFTAAPGTRLAIPTIAHRDLGWELTTSPAAIDLATDDLSAGLLRRALADTGWIATRDRQRWSTSWTGASTIVRLMRCGRPAPALRSDPRHLLDGAVAELLAGLGWIAERPRAHEVDTED